MKNAKRTSNLDFNVQLFWKSKNNLNACTQDTIRFLQENTKFYRCTQTAIRFLQRNTKFYSCTQTAIHFSQRNKKFRTVPKLPFILWLQNTNFLKLFRNSHFLFDNKLKKSKVASKLPLVFWLWNTSYEVVPKRPFAFN